MSETRTPVVRCDLNHNRTSREHNELCPIWERERDVLESRGWFQEQFAYMRTLYQPWDMAVWNHKWNLVKDQCELCHSEGPCIRAVEKSLCLECLDEFPWTPWHPTGGVRPKMRDLISHATKCAQH